MTLLIVTPMHNERDNVAGLLDSLRHQTFTDFDWIVVDDGSTDATAERITELDTQRLATVLSKSNDGGLIGGSAYTSWRHGVTRGLSDGTYSHIMKLDADVRLASDYLARVVPLASGDVGIAGGVIVSPGMVEQKFHVPGPVKLYTLAAYEVAMGMPAAIGFDVMDEVAAAEQGLRTLVDVGARFELARAIGASEGHVHGRYRNGRVCRWTGYSFPYFLVHCARYSARKPYVVGALAMLWGYLTAGPGPYAPALKHAHAASQRAKLAQAVRNPLGFWRRAYQV